MDFVCHQHGTEDADGKVGIEQRMMRVGLRNRGNKAVGKLAPLWPKFHGRYRENNHHQAGQAENALHPLKFEKKDENSKDCRGGK